MKQPVQPRDPRDLSSSNAASSPISSSGDSTLSGAALSLTQKRVLEFLGDSTGSLTVRQMEAALQCDGAELVEAIDGLVGLSLVSRLNTIIPSYANRYPGVRVYGE